MAQHVYFGQWVWRDDNWEAPVQGLPHANFDFRSVAACASPGFSAGHGLFVYPQLVSDPGLTYLGERNAPVGTARKTAIKTLLGLGENIVAATVGEMAAELLLQHAEPEWNLRWGRIRGREWKLVCLGEVWKSAYWRDADPQWLLILESLRANYQKVKAGVAQGGLPADYHRKFLQSQMERYQVVNYEDITQNSLETPLPHGTSWTESWPTVSSTISSGQDQVWTEVANDSAVTLISLANRLSNVTTAADVTARCETTLADDAHYCQATHRWAVVANAGAYGGPMTRFAAAADTGYLYRYRTNAGSESRFDKKVTGTKTNLATFDDATPSADTDYVLRLTSTATDTHTCTKDSTDVISAVSDAAITGNVLGGLIMSGNNVAQMNESTVSAADLAAAVEDMPPWMGDVPFVRHVWALSY